MEKQNVEQPDIKKILFRILLVTAAIVLPGTDWAIFGWLHLVLPSLIFYVILEHGMYSGNRVAMISAGLGFAVLLALSSVPLFVFAATLLPVGYILAHSAHNKDSPVVSGAKGTLFLVVCWTVLLSGIVIPGDQSPYMQLIESLHMGIDEAIKYYRSSDSGSVEVDMILESTLQQMKVVVPVILPAILACFALIIVWVTLIVGNWIVAKRCNKQCWPHFQYWVLPEQLIWLTIFTGGAAFVPVDAIRFLSANILILLALIYCFQGFSITVFYMNKWNMPVIFRSFIYVMVIFQSFGTIILLIVGIADTWLDFRKLSSLENKE